MPIYMDRHDVSDSVTAETVAELHQKDLKIQHQFKCRGLTYWFDDVRKTAFCLIEAPSEESIKEMHDHAHGEVPHHIIEVEPAIVESFLGRIEDPLKAKDTQLNVINDRAFRIIMVVEPEINLFRLLNESYRTQVIETLQKFDGSMVMDKENRFLVSFTSVSRAVKCALKIQLEYHKKTDKITGNSDRLKIGLSAGVPVTEKESLFEDTIKRAEEMCHVNAGITVSEEVKDLYRSENLNNPTLDGQIYVLSGPDQKFLTRLVEFTEKERVNASLSGNSFQRHLGLSKTQLYRKMTSLTGNSLNSFLLLYRLKRVLQLLHKNNNSIAEIAYAEGFNSPSYFAKCFRKVLGVSPSAYKNLI